MIIHDQHCHSYFSLDSNASIKRYYAKAKRLGCSYFVLTDHFDLDCSYTKRDWLVDFDKQKKVLSKLKNGPQVLLGVELGYRKDYFNRILEESNKENFDIINLSIHDSGKVEYYFEKMYIQNGIDNTMKMYYEQMLEAVTNFDNFDVLSHLDYGYKTAYLIDNKYDFFKDIDIIKQIMKKVIEKDKALEINLKVQNVLGTKHTRDLLELYKSLGGKKVTLSSDAHEYKKYHEGFETYYPIFKECGFNELCYFIQRKCYFWKIEC